MCGITLLALFSLGATECQSNAPIILPDGPAATQLGKTKDEQIKGLTQQVKDEQAARELEKQQAALAAANFDGVLFAAEHVETGLPRNAIEEEAKLGKARSPAPDPQEVIKAKDRVIAILQNEVAKAKEMYGQAFNEAAQAKAVVAQKDKDIADRAQFIIELNDKIGTLTTAAATEREQHKNDVLNKLADKDKEIQKVKDDFASKERKTWVLWTRIAGLGFIIIGAVLAIVLKMATEGASFVGVGVLIGLVSIFIDWLTSQPWFPWACLSLLVLIIGLGGYALYRVWVKHQLDDKKTQAIQDMIDEATAKGDMTAVNALKEHLTYRLGPKDSFWGARQGAEIVKLGLVDPKGEKALQTPVAPPPTVDTKV